MQNIPQPKVRPQGPTVYSTQPSAGYSLRKIPKSHSSQSLNIYNISSIETRPRLNTAHENFSQINLVSLNRRDKIIKRYLYQKL